MPLNADGAVAQPVLDQTAVELPAALNAVELTAYAQAHPTLGELTLAPESRGFAFWLLEVPLTVAPPPGYRLSRLRLDVAAQCDPDAPHQTGDGAADEIVVHDLFPKTHIDIETITNGKATLDVSPSLEFVLLASGPAALYASATKCLDLKLSVPFRMSGEKATLQTTGRRSSAIRWAICDEEIQAGFTPKLIVRAPRGARVVVTATLLGELRSAGAPAICFAAPARRYEVS